LVISSHETRGDRGRHPRRRSRRCPNEVLN
jgi:hypothetical protein